MEYKTKEEEKTRCLNEPEVETYMTGNQNLSLEDWWNRVPEEEKKNTIGHGFIIYTVMQELRFMARGLC